MNYCIIKTVRPTLKSRSPTLQKILYEISKSFDFIEITLISSDFTDFKMISLISSINNYFDNNISNRV